jgi:Swt1-like HEPN
MADVYLSLFCLENSARRHIEKTLSQALGNDWWDVAASFSMKRKEQDRRNNEAQNKWIPSRSSAGPLYSLDWPDLVTLMRKYEELFKGSIPDINFLHRFSDLGNLRNVIAHNGIIDDPMQFKRIELALHDWAKQIHH